MDLMRFLKVTICAASLGIALGACGQSATETATTNVARDASADQAVWSKLTADAETAKKNGDLKKAEEDYKAAILEAEKLGSESADVAKTTANLADFYYAQGDGGQADKLYQKSLAMQEKVLGSEHADLAQSLIGLARVSSKEKKYAASANYYSRAIAIMKKANVAPPADVEQEYAGVKAKSGSEASKNEKESG